MRDIRITISLSGEELKVLEDRMFLGRYRSLSSYIRGVLFPDGTILGPKIAEKQKGRIEESGSMVDEFVYEDIIERVSKSFEYEMDFEERAELNKAIKEAGLVWNAYLKRLEKPEDGKFKLIKQF